MIQPWIGQPSDVRNVKVSGVLSVSSLGDYGRGGVQAGGIGLRNVHQRIRLFYGNDYGIEVKSEQGKYTQVTMTFRLVR